MTVVKRAEAVAVAALCALTFIVDVFLLPSDLVTILYALPVLLASQFWRMRGVVAVTALAGAFDVASMVVTRPPWRPWLVTFLALLAVGFLAAQLAVQRQRTEEARLRLQRFMGMVAHDLGGPLTALRGYTQLLGRQTAGTLAPREQQLVQSVEAASGQLRRLVDDLHDAASAGAGSFVLHRAPGQGSSFHVELPSG